MELTAAKARLQVAASSTTPFSRRDSMLVLSRKTGERIKIGENIEIVISRITGDRCQVGIEAPREVKVIRTELADRPETLKNPRRAA